MADPKANSVANHSVTTQVRDCCNKCLEPGGYLDQARAAQAQGILSDFFQKLMTTLGPIIGQIIIQFLSGLIPHVPPVPSPNPGATK